MIHLLLVRASVIILLFVLLGCMLRGFRVIRKTRSSSVFYPNHLPVRTRSRNSYSNSNKRVSFLAERTHSTANSAMLKRAVDFHEASQENTGQVAAKWQPKSNSSSITATLADTFKKPVSSTNAVSVPLSTGTGNAPKVQTTKPTYQSSQVANAKEHGHGLKRTASGLAKALGGQDVFELANSYIVKCQQSPAVSDEPQRKNRMDDVYIDENDFDSDIDLDIEDPALKGTIAYPKIPSDENIHTTPLRGSYHSATTSPSKPTISLKNDASKTQRTDGVPNSSMPLPWSSSPASQHQVTRRAVPLKDRTNEQPHSELDRNEDVHASASVSTRPAKRRVLPWEKEKDVPITSTPKVKKAQSQYLWDATASALKEKQKQLRDKGKIAKLKDAAEKDNSTLKPKSKKSGVSRVFLSDEQQHVLDLVINQKKSVFYTGSAGKEASLDQRLRADIT